MPNYGPPPPPPPGKTSFLTDEPTTEDRLGRESYAEAFANLTSDCGTPLVVGLYGGWGVGKTTLLNLIASKLKPNVRVVRFDAWQHQNDDAPAVSLLHTIVNELGLESRAGKILTLVGLALGSTLLKPIAVNLTDLKKLGDQFEQERFAVRDARVRLRERFGELLDIATEGGQQRLAIFIDDLDRCSPAATFSLLEALKLYLNFPNCVFFLAVDRLIVEQSIRRHYESESNQINYLEKIIQLPFNIPPITPQSIEKFISPLLTPALQNCKDLLISGLGDNPRAVKRFINVLSLNHHLATAAKFDGYDPRVMALLLLIQYWAPSLYAEVEQDPEMLRRALNNESEAAELAQKHQRLQAIIASARSQKLIQPNMDITGYLYLTSVARIETLPRDGEDGSHAEGIVKWFDAEKGYGFIKDNATDRECFVHYSDISALGFKHLDEGERVSFQMSENPKGWVAKKVIKLDAPKSIW